MEKNIICPHCEGRVFKKIKACQEGKLQCKYCHRIVSPDERMFTKDFVLNTLKSLYKNSEENNNVHK